MYNVLIDPLSLVLSAKYLNAKNFHTYLDDLIDTNELSEYDFLNPLILEETFSLMYGNDGYLDVYEIEKWLGEFNLDYKYTPNDIIMAVQSIMKFAVIENEFQVEKISLNNLKELDENNEVLGEAYKNENFLRYSLSKLLNGETYLKGKIDVYLKCTGAITHLEVNKHFINGAYKIEESLKAFPSIHQILMDIDIYRLWKICNQESEFVKLIEIYFKKITSEKEKNTWKLGIAFFENFKKHGFYIEDKKIKNLLKAMFKVVYKESIRDSHKLRSSASGGAPQIEGRLGKAWRIDIDYEYHLHYWINQNHVVFAWVGTHNEFYIPDEF